MWAVRKTGRAGAHARGGAGPRAGGRRGARRGRGGVHLRHRPAHPPLGRVGAAPDQAAADARPRVRRHRRRDRPRRTPRRRRRLRLRREPRHLRHVLPLPHRPGAHVRADADPRRRPRRRVRRLRGRARVRRLAERPREASARDRHPAGAVRQRRLRDRRRRTSPGARSPCSAAGRSGCSPSRSPARSAPPASLASDRVPFRLELARAWARTASTSARPTTCRSGSSTTTRVSASRSSSRCPARRGPIEDAFAIVRNGGHVVLFGIPARPVEIDVAESLIFKNLT